MTLVTMQSFSNNTKTSRRCRQVWTVPNPAKDCKRHNSGKNLHERRFQSDPFL